MSEPTATPIWLNSADGTPIALHDFGGSGPALLICHATGFNAGTYAPLIAEWRSSFSVWGIDLRGHGRSQLSPEDTFVWDDFVDDALAAIDHIGGPILAFGHSMGGATLLLAEAKRPGVLSRAWVYEPIIFPAEIGPRNSHMSAAALKRRSNFASKAEALARYASRPPLNLLRADSLAAYVEHGFVDDDDGTVRLACRPVHEAMTFDGAKIPATRVTDVTTPVIVGQGYVLPGQPSAAEFAKGTAEALEHATLRVYDDLGHFGPLEAPARIANDVAAALLA